MAKRDEQRVAAADDMQQVATYLPQSLVDQIESMAKSETRKRAQMLRVLIEEAMAARAARVAEPVA